MNAPHEYDETHVPPYPAIGVSPKKYDALNAAARAVIAAGRPHVRSYDLSEPCPCPQCAAWDDLAELLKKA